MADGDCKSGKATRGNGPEAASAPEPPLPWRDSAGGGWQDEAEPEAERRWLLLSRIDPERFRYFYEKHYPEILTYLHRLCGDRGRAEDLAAETFYQAQDHLCQFRWRGRPFKAWLYRIAGNAYRKHARRRRRWVMDRRQSTLAERLSELPDPQTQAIESERDRLLHSCLAELDEQDRELIVLHYWQDLSLPQIAGVLGCKVGTVKSRIDRARDRLQQRLEAAERDKPAGRGMARLELIRGVARAAGRSPGGGSAGPEVR